MCLLAAKACGAEDLESHRKLAAIIEMLHTATLVRKRCGERIRI